MPNHELWPRDMGYALVSAVSGGAPRKCLVDRLPQGANNTMFYFYCNFVTDFSKFQTI